MKIRMDSMLKVKRLNFEYSPEKRILNEINFQIEKGSFVSVLGESGSGKSTLLKLIYGLEDATFGQIIWNEKKVTGPKFNLVPGNPEMKFVPQEFDLLDYVTVAENTGKFLSNFDLSLKAKTIDEALKVVDLATFLNELPTKLSGGQRQRVSIARAIAGKPQLLLLDEPYSHLDQPLKYQIRKSLWSWAKRNNSTVILTTHDVNDALGFSDKIIIIRNGQILQMDSPENLRNNPVNEYVASLLGEYSILNSEEMNHLFQMEIPENQQAIIYPEEIIENENGIEFKISDIRFQGRDYLVEAKNKLTKIKFYSKSIPDGQFIKLTVNNFRLV